MKLAWLVLSLIFISAVSVAFIRIKLPHTRSSTPSFNTDFAFDNRTFLPSVAKFQNTSPAPPPQVLVLPHHLLASDLIARGISLFTSKPPETIVLLSPNHANLGQCDIISSFNSWNTPYGSVEVDKKLLQGFLDSRAVCLDDRAMEIEHGVAGLLPFIHYFLPQTKIVPLIFKKDIEPNLFHSFTKQLISSSASFTTLVSLDFSHGLKQLESLKRDDITRKLIEDHNLSELSKLGSEYVDSPPALIAALEIINALGLKLQFLDHTDSSSYNHVPDNVTSYFLLSGLDQSNTNQAYTLLFGGDVMLGRSVNTRILKHSDYSWPFRKISSLLSEADLTIVNLESPFRTGCLPTDSGMVFCANPQSIDGLVTAGVDIVNLANNHINNQGPEGIAETIDILNKNNISYVGVDPRVDSQKTIFTIKNTKIIFLGFTDIGSGSKDISTATPENIRLQISTATESADLVIATFHWGNEYSKRSLRQVGLAHLAIDSGADVVIGHHPHWVQEVEEYHGKPIYYSLGNLVFDQMWSEETRKGLLVRLNFSGKDLTKQEQIPIKIFDYGQPSILPN